MLTQDGHEFKVKIETLEETEARLERIIAAWAEDDINQRRLASVFELRFDGQLWPEQYRFDGRRGRWMEFVSRRETPWAGQWRPAQTILDGVGGLIERLCGDNPSKAAKWGKVAVYSIRMFWPWQRNTLPSTNGTPLIAC